MKWPFCFSERTDAGTHGCKIRFRKVFMEKIKWRYEFRAPSEETMARIERQYIEMTADREDSLINFNGRQTLRHPNDKTGLSHTYWQRIEDAGIYSR